MSFDEQLLLSRSRHRWEKSQRVRKSGHSAQLVTQAIDCKKAAVAGRVAQLVPNLPTLTHTYTYSLRQRATSYLGHPSVPLTLLGLPVHAPFVGTTSRVQTAGNELDGQPAVTTLPPTPLFLGRCFSFLWRTYPAKPYTSPTLAVVEIYYHRRVCVFGNLCTVSSLGC